MAILLQTIENGQAKERLHPKGPSAPTQGRCFVQPLINYVFAISPAFMLFAALLAIIPQSIAPFRIALQILFFILARDAMTGQGFWQIGEGSLRFTAPPTIFVALGVLSLGLALGVYLFESSSRKNVIWTGSSIPLSITAGIGGMLTILAITEAIKQLLKLPELPHPGTDMLPTLLFFALAGNAYEELLFRGFLQGELYKHMSMRTAALASGLIFCVCHSFLATTVTNIGLPIYVFTLIEGIIAAFIYIRGGLLAATIAHGGTIFILSAWL